MVNSIATATSEPDWHLKAAIQAICGCLETMRLTVVWFSFLQGLRWLTSRMHFAYR
jgi:hypothetical protein